MRIGALALALGIGTCVACGGAEEPRDEDATHGEEEERGEVLLLGAPLPGRRRRLRRVRLRLPSPRIAPTRRPDRATVGSPPPRTRPRACP